MEYTRYVVRWIVDGKKREDVCLWLDNANVIAAHLRLLGYEPTISTFKYHYPKDDAPSKDIEYGN